MKQYHMVDCLDYFLDANLSGESMAVKYLQKFNTKLQFWYRQNEFLNPKLHRLLWKSLIQPHFDHACTSWYPFVSQKMRRKIHVTQNKSIRFWLKPKFKEIHWLPTKERVEQRVTKKVFKCWKWTPPFYVNEPFVPSQNTYRTRSNMVLEILSRKVT